MGIEVWVDEESGEIHRNGKPFTGNAQYRTYRRFEGLGPAEAYSKTIKKRNKPDKSSGSNDSGGGSGKFHGLYCLLVGWWLAMVITCMIVPLFFKGGRRLIKKAFGIW